MSGHFKHIIKIVPYLKVVLNEVMLKIAPNNILPKHLDLIFI